MAKKKTSQIPKDEFAPVEDLDICTFTSEPIVTGECISLFSFDDDLNKDISKCNNENNATSTGTANNRIDFSISSDDTKNNTYIIANSSTNTDSNPQNNLTDNRKISVSNGITPPINGEFLNIKRTYMLRASTVRKINELKSIHSELNTYVSTIVDMAIAHYYNHITNECRNQ